MATSAKMRNAPARVGIGMTRKERPFRHLRHSDELSLLYIYADSSLATIGEGEGWEMICKMTSCHDGPRQHLSFYVVHIVCMSQLDSGVFSEEIIRYRYMAVTETDLLARKDYYPEKDGNITAIKK